MRVDPILVESILKGILILFVVGLFVYFVFIRYEDFAEFVRIIIGPGEPIEIYALKISVYFGVAIVIFTLIGLFLFGKSIFLERW